MKKIFAAFCALVLMPSFSAQAWIGGPFSNNSYFGEDGDDGVYEAVALPYGKGARNGIGLYRWGVTNNFTGVDDQSTLYYTVSGPGGSSDIRVPLSGNVEFGGVGHFTHSWYIEGVYYRGFCQGSVNSGLGTVNCTGGAYSAVEFSGIVESISSGFRASFTSRNDGLPVQRFEGRGHAAISDGRGRSGLEPFHFAVFGSKVASKVNYYGVQL